MVTTTRQPLKSSFTALIRSQCQAPHSFEYSCVWTEFRKESFLDPENGILNTKPQRSCPSIKGQSDSSSISFDQFAVICRANAPLNANLNLGTQVAAFMCH